MPGNAMVAISNYYGILSVYNSSILTGVTRILDLNTDTGASQMNQTTATEAADSAAPTTAKVEKVFSSYKIDKLKLTWYAILANNSFFIIKWYPFFT